MPEEREIRVFLASAGDVEEERHLFREVLATLSSRRGVRFTPLGWEDTLAVTGRRPQDVINGLVDQCDVFVAVFHRRWGQNAPEAVANTSYTEEEFERALRRLGATGSPEIFCFFKHIDLASLADPGEQLQKVLGLRRRLEESRQVLYRTFGTAADFVTELEAHLVAFAEDALPAPRTPGRRIHLPILEDRGPELDREHGLALLSQAKLAAEAGRVEEAAALFARLSQTSCNIQILDMTRLFFDQAGNSDAAQAVLERKLALLHDRRLAAHEYVAVLMFHGWLEELVAATLATVPEQTRETVRTTLTTAFTGSRFRELLIDSMAEHFSVGELLSLARFYRGEGRSVASKLGQYMGTAIPSIIAIMASENPELFSGQPSTG
jgi:hypothetical protein